MSTLDDFFGDGRVEKTPECSYCGGTSGELIVSIRDAYGPTHWHHKECRATFEAKRATEAQERRDAAARAEARDAWEDNRKPQWLPEPSGTEYSDQIE